MLEWQLKNANKLKRLEQFKALKASGVDAKFLQDQPEVEAFHHFLWSGWACLNMQRGSDDGKPQPLQLRDIEAYLNLTGRMDEDDREDFLDVVLSLDFIFMKFVREEIEKANKKGAKPGKPTPSRPSRSRGRRR